MGAAGAMMVGWFGFTIFLILVGLVIWLVVNRTRGGDADRASARRILNERLARGDIDIEEYTRRSDALR